MRPQAPHTVQWLFPEDSAKAIVHVFTAIERFFEYQSADTAQHNKTKVKIIWWALHKKKEMVLALTSAFLHWLIFSLRMARKSPCSSSQLLNIFFSASQTKQISMPSPKVLICLVWYQRALSKRWTRSSIKGPGFETCAGHLLVDSDPV